MAIVKGILKSDVEIRLKSGYIFFNFKVLSQKLWVIEK
jgi:hypothetical protein